MSRLLSLVLVSALPLSLTACLDAEPDEGFSEEAVTGEQGLHGAPERTFEAKDARPGGGGGGGSPLMTSHGGTVLTASKTMAIFWGSEWSTPSFAGDKITGLDTFFQGYGGSAYAGASTEYAGTNGQVTAASTYLGHAFDTTAAPRKALTTSAAVAEACKITGDAPDPAALYLIYTSTGAGHVSYCAWHSWGTCANGAPIQVAYMPNIDGLSGCDPADTSGLHSQGLAAVANVTAHELAEAITDPRGAGWFDSGGAENGDKCAWRFSPNNNGLVTLSNGSKWKLQGEWSNAAYTAGTGYPNSSGQAGCLPFN
ncbi:MAG: hypothetical protein K8W52_28675 [Deltaproteobacteria bacterium]|nr:hypothetical protein [Deltaproteobacteria bacterium]